MDWKRNIIFFDGQCNLCNRFIDFIVRSQYKQQDQRFYIASLQGHHAQKYLPQTLTTQLSSVVLYIPHKSEPKIYTHSQAAILILSTLKSYYKPLKFFLLFPPSWRDGLYKFIARHRYQWFGKRSTCRLPTPEEESFFLD
jgi:predicted DCC family thiol-disulfide oxidoreductase YuxK